MQLDKRQKKLGPVKSKDRYLYNEIVYHIKGSRWDKAFDELLLLQPANQSVASNMKDDNGWNILHYACNTQAPEYAINILFDNNRKAIQSKTDDGYFALHLAIEHQPDTVVLQLLQSFTEAAKTKYRLPKNQIIKDNADDWYPLHYACIRKRDLQQTETCVVRKLLEVFPLAAQHKDNRDRYPLHLACLARQRETVVLPLLLEFPEAAQQTSRCGSTPLHIASKHGDESVVLHLLKACPKATAMEDIVGAYPLHLACRDNPFEPAVHELIDAFTQAAKHKDNYGFYPLHFACMKLFTRPTKQLESVVVKLVKLFPEAVQEKTSSGQYPLHIACKDNAPLSIIKLLVFHYPHALVCIDNNEKKTPLDWAQYPTKHELPVVENVEFVKDATVNYKQTVFNNKKQKLQSTPETY